MKADNTCRNCQFFKRKLSEDVFGKCDKLNIEIGCEKPLASNPDPDILIYDHYDDLSNCGMVFSENFGCIKFFSKV